MADEDAASLVRASLLAPGGAAKGAARDLVQEAARRGASDNVTAVVVSLVA